MIDVQTPNGFAVTAAVFGINLGAEDAVIAAAVTILLALLRAFAYVVTGKRDRERELYGKAYRAAMAWRQMLYRVRTRAPGSTHKLLERFDKLQVMIDYYQGWTASEGRWIGRSYARLIDDIQHKTSPLIQGAWSMTYDERLPTNDARDSAGHPDTNEARDRFLKDVRNHLSLFIFPKIAVWWRSKRWTQRRARKKAWENGFDHLQRFVQREGLAHGVPYKQRENDFRLGLWVGNQQMAYDRGDLSASERKRLADLKGWEWTHLGAPVAGDAEGMQQRRN